MDYFVVSFPIIVLKDDEKITNRCLYAKVWERMKPLMNENKYYEWIIKERRISAYLKELGYKENLRESNNDDEEDDDVEEEKCRSLEQVAKDVEGLRLFKDWMVEIIQRRIKSGSVNEELDVDRKNLEIANLNVLAGGTTPEAWSFANNDYVEPAVGEKNDFVYDRNLTTSFNCNIPFDSEDSYYFSPKTRAFYTNHWIGRVCHSWMKVIHLLF
jgi:hypothetical protein